MPKTFALMKPSAVIINTARGPLIDEESLIEALQANVWQEPHWTSSRWNRFRWIVR
jgi:hypothetical protein